MASEEEKKQTTNKKPKKKLKKIKLDIIEQGDNKLYPKNGDKVIFNYETKYYGGNKHKLMIDSGIKEIYLGRGEIIKGWKECFLGNKISLGSKVKIKIPNNLCFGYHIDIEYGQDLLFMIELLQINDIKRIIKKYQELNIKILKEGDNKIFPLKNDYVIIHYEGFFHGGDKDKNKFDSSIDRDKLFGFKIGKKQVIKGLEEGISKLSKGSKAILEIPSKFGYGDKGSPDKIIPKNQDLRFKIEIIDIKKKNK